LRLARSRLARCKLRFVDPSILRCETNRLGFKSGLEKICGRDVDGDNLRQAAGCAIIV
jgi:hypothetical protein